MPKKLFYISISNVFASLGVAIFFCWPVYPQGKAESYKAGNIFVDCTVCPEMIVVPSGYFIIGSRDGKMRELPLKKITIPKPFAIGRFEISFDEWDACFSDGGCSNKVDDRNWGRSKRPVINVLYSDILEYISWISDKTGQTYRLPSEAEWEYSARAGTSSEYWWGNEMVFGYANCRRCDSLWGGIQTSPVGSFRANPWGLYDVHGNVLEYVQDCWSKNHDGISAYGTPKIGIDCISRVAKGGAWYYLPSVSRAASRVRNDSRVFSYLVGFRILRELK